MKFEAVNGNLLPLAVAVPGNCNVGDEVGGGVNNAVGGGGDMVVDINEEGGDTCNDSKDLHEELAMTMEGSEDSAADKELLTEHEKDDTQEDHDISKMDMELDDVGGGGGDDAADKEPSSVGAKKKGTRKKRSTNWEEGERSLLLEVIKPKVEYVENRCVDSKNVKAKTQAWLHITKQFNAMNFRHRSLDQIKVQWRSIKNFAKREYQIKHPNGENVEGLGLVEFMEEIHKETSTVRAAPTRGAVSKKEQAEPDDEDTPLAALPALGTGGASTNSSDDNTMPTTTTTTNVARPFSPQSPIESPQHETSKDEITTTPSTTRKRKRPGPQSGSKTKAQAQQNAAAAAAAAATAATIETSSVSSGKGKRQRTQTIKKEPETISNSSNTNAIINNDTPLAVEQSQLALALSAGTENVVAVLPTFAVSTPINNNLSNGSKKNIQHINDICLNSAITTVSNNNNNTSCSNNNANNNINHSICNSSNNINNNNNNNINGSSNSSIIATNNLSSLAVDEKYKKQMFDILKRARLNEMDYMRREHEQKLRFEQMEQELKLKCYHQKEELKARLMRDEHELRIRHYQAEHEARMRVYATNISLRHMNAKNTTSTSTTTTRNTEAAAAAANNTINNDSNNFN